MKMQAEKSVTPTSFGQLDIEGTMDTTDIITDTTMVITDNTGATTTAIITDNTGATTTDIITDTTTVTITDTTTVIIMVTMDTITTTSSGPLDTSVITMLINITLSIIKPIILITTTTSFGPLDTMDARRSSIDTSDFRYLASKTLCENFTSRQKFFPRLGNNKFSILPFVTTSLLTYTFI